jgi:hypothetical protein
MIPARPVTSAAPERRQYLTDMSDRASRLAVTAR